MVTGQAKFAGSVQQMQLWGGSNDCTSDGHLKVIHDETTRNGRETGNIRKHCKKICTAVTATGMWGLFFLVVRSFFFFSRPLVWWTQELWATCTVFSFYAGTFPSSFMCSIFLLTHNWWTEHGTKTLNVSHNNRATTMRDNEKRKTSSTMEEDNPSRNVTAPKKTDRAWT